jgi:hypothetical protein
MFGVYDSWNLPDRFDTSVKTRDDATIQTTSSRGCAAVASPALFPQKASDRWNSHSRAPSRGSRTAYRAIRPARTSEWSVDSSLVPGNSVRARSAREPARGNALSLFRRFAAADQRTVVSSRRRVAPAPPIAPPSSRRPDTRVPPPPNHTPIPRRRDRLTLHAHARERSLRSPPLVRITRNPHPLNLNNVRTRLQDGRVRRERLPRLPQGRRA